MVSKAPGSVTVGFLEQVLYVYCLTSTHREFIGSILLFKAFLGWLQISATAAAPAQATATITGRLEFNAPSSNPIPIVIAETPAVRAGSGEYRGMLAGFYIYAIGNFVSLSVAILVFEIVHLWESRFSPLVFSGIWPCWKW
jgi:hypothetical protein